MRHRHLSLDTVVAPESLGLAALDDVLDRGDLDDWQPVLKAIRHDPWGDVAERILRLADGHPMYGTTALWRAWINEQRAETPAWHAGGALRALRLARGARQREVAERLGMTQPEVSKLEHRHDVRLSSARAYVVALGGSLQLVASFPDGETPIPPDAGHTPTSGRARNDL